MQIEDVGLVVVGGLTVQGLGILVLTGGVTVSHQSSLRPLRV